MIAAIALLIACQALGELIHAASGAPLPGTIIGLFLLLAWLAVRRRERPNLEKVAGWLIAHLSVMFVPAAVGVMQEGRLFARYGLAIGLATAVSAIATMLVTVLVFHAVAQRTEASS